jgi:hypothetical protein
VYEGTSNVGGRARICYVFKPAPDGTHFHRELVWEQTNWVMKFCDWLFVRGIIERASANALPVLKSRLESQTAPRLAEPGTPV